MKEYLKKVLDSADTASAKRFVTLLIVAHFIVSAFTILFFIFYLVIFTPKGSVNLNLLSILQNILEYDFYIILAGLGFITTDSLGNMLLERMKVKAAANVATGNPTVDTLNTTKADTVKTDNIEVVNTQSVTQPQQ